MKETNNLKLKKPAQSDFYNIDDFNYNSDVIDEAIYKIYKQIDEINPDAGSITYDNKMSGLKAVNVKEAIDEVNGKSEANKTSILEVREIANQAKQCGDEVKQELVDKLISEGLNASTNENFEEIINRIKIGTQMPKWFGTRWITGGAKLSDGTNYEHETIAMGNYIYLLGGKDIYNSYRYQNLKYNYINNTITNNASVPAKIFSCNVVKYSDTEFLMCNGTTIYFYNIETNTWRNIIVTESIPSSKMVAYFNEGLYYTNGSGVIKKLDIDNNIITEIGKISISEGLGTMFNIKNKLYFIYTNPYVSGTSKIREYDIITNTFTEIFVTLPDDPTITTNSTVYKNGVFIFGEGNNGIVRYYDLDTKIMTTMPNHEGVSYFAACVIDNSLHIFNGGSSSSSRPGGAGRHEIMIIDF